MASRTRTLVVLLADGSTVEHQAQHQRTDRDGVLRLFIDGEVIATFESGTWLSVSEAA